MNCFSCFKPKRSNSIKEKVPVAQTRDIAQPPKPAPEYSNPKPKPKPKPPTEVNKIKNYDANEPPVDSGNSSVKTFTFRELATATKNFRQECLLGEGGFGRVYKGTLQPSGQVVAVKQLYKNSTQGNKEFLVEILMLSLLHHPNLVNLIGYCADGDQRLLVYEYLPKGSLELHLLDLTPEEKPLDWGTRMKIAYGIAQGLEYLHEKANPPVIYRDLKTSNIMVDGDLNPKLTDYGLAKLGGNKSNVTSRVMGNYVYCAPEYEKHGELTPKSDVYCFGVVLLELITGRRALDTSRPTDEQNLVTWAQPIFRDPKRFPEMADPLLRNEFPVKSLNQVVGVAAMCLQDESDVRPVISDVVATLSFLAVDLPYDHHTINSNNKENDTKQHSGTSVITASDRFNIDESVDDEETDGSNYNSEHSSKSLDNEEEGHQQGQVVESLKDNIEDEHSQHGTSSSRPKRKSTKKHEGKVRSSSVRRSNKNSRPKSPGSSL